jgi:uncharacterized protein
MTKMFSKVFSLALILALVFGALPITSRPVQALSADIVISQVYGGGGNTGAPYTHDFIELFNRGTTTVSLSGMSVQYASATGTGNFGSNPVTLLSGSLAPGQYYLVRQSGGTTGVALPTPDVIGSVNMSASAGKVALVNSTTGLACNGGSTPCDASQLALIKDLVGYGGANFYETAAAPLLSNTTAALRLANGCTETDNNALDFAAGAPTPRNTASPLNPCTTVEDAAPEVASTYPVDGATDFPINANLTVTFSEPVDVTDPWFDLSCSVSGAVSATYSGGPTTFTLDPSISLVGGESTPPSIDPGQRALSAAITGTVTTQGVVVGDFEGTASASGFYLQDLTGDGDPPHPTASSSLPAIPTLSAWDRLCA